MTSILFTILINSYPLFLFALPFLYLKYRKSKFLPIYSRLYIGLVLFFIVYWVLPSIYQDTGIAVPNDPNTDNFGHGLLFITIRAFSLLGLYLQYPLTLLPFIFIFAPILSLVILYLRLKKEANETGKSKLDLITYEFTDSPKNMIQKAIERRDWKQEWTIFKGFLILLPISLYLLTVILDIANLPPVNIAESESALGWFIEILFGYIATFLLGYQLINSSKISYNGRFIGEQIQSRFFTSLTQVGTPIAILSTLLFIAQKQDSITLIIYFFAYFLMAAYIFIVALQIFEPFSIFIFLKLLQWLKSQKKVKFSLKSDSVWYCLVYTALATFITLIIASILSLIVDLATNMVPGGENYDIFSLIGSNPSFKQIQLTELLLVLNSLQAIGIPLILGVFFAKLLQRDLGHKIWWFFYVVILFVFTIIISLIEYTSGTGLPLLLNSTEYWINGKPIEITLFGQEIFSMRTAFLNAEFESKTVLGILAIPFTFFRPFANVIFWGIVFLYTNRKLINRKIDLPEQTGLIENISYIELKHLESIKKSFLNPKTLITLSSNRNFERSIPNSENSPKEDLRSQILSLLDHPEGIFLHEFEKHFSFTDKTVRKALYTLTKNGMLTWWLPEFTYQYERATLDGLYLLYEDGRALVFHNFRKDQKQFVEPELVSGMFSALTSFIQETTRTTTKVAAIDSGDKKVILEYSQEFPIFVALFADRENAAVRQALKGLLKAFTNRHLDILNNWSGDVSIFYGDKQLVLKFFEPFL